MLHRLPQLFQEPGINRRHFVNPRGRVTGTEGKAQVTQAVRRRRDQFLRNQINIEGFRPEFPASFQAPDSLAQRFLKRTPDGHDFAHRLHLRAQRRIGTGEFFKRPLGNFYHHIIDGGFKRSRGNLRNVVANFIEPVAHSQFGRDFRDRETRCF